MKAVVLPEIGPSSKLQFTDSQPLPTLKPGQLLVKNAYAGINYIDTYFRSGLYPSAVGYPMILGQEAAGVVADVSSEGDTLGFKAGDRVVWIAQGGYAEYTAVPAHRTIKIPEGLSDDQAVGGFLMGMTALSLVRESYPVQKGDKVLVHAAAGGVGLLLCQLLRDIGAFTIGTAGSPEKCKLAEQYGANVTIDYNANTNWVEKVKELTDGNGVDVVYDSVGKTTFDGSLDSIKRKGKCESFSFTLSFFQLEVLGSLLVDANNGSLSQSCNLAQHPAHRLSSISLVWLPRTSPLCE
jgi:NADPH:quinone reductase